MQYAKKLFSALLTFLVEESGLDEERIIKGKSEECVDVRAVLIKKLAELGVTNARITILFGCTPQAVSKILNSYEDRARRSLTMRKLYKDTEEHIDANMVVLRDVVNR